MAANEHIITAQFEEYVCKLFGQRKVWCVNIARQQMLWEKYNKDTIISDVSPLLPESHSTWLDRKYVHNVGEHAIP